MTWYDKFVRLLSPRIEYHQNRYARELGALVAPGTRWLDLGAGARIHGAWIGPTGAELRARAGMLVGCDLGSQHMRRNPDLATACAADGTALPFRSGAFDLVTANMVVEHLEHPEFVFKEVARVLRVGGSFLLVTPNRAHPLLWLASTFLAPGARRRYALGVEARPAEHVFRTFYRANSVAAVAGLARSAGLEIGQLETFSSYPLTRFAPLTGIEYLWIRLSARAAFAPFRSNLVACLKLATPCDASGVVQ